MSLALLPVSACLAAKSDQLQWFSVSTPGQTALRRADVGMVGQDDNPSMLLDLCAWGGSYTGIDLQYQTDQATVEGLRWTRNAVDFELETAVEAMPGLVFGLDAIDHHPRTTATDAGAKWELFDPQGGLRVGGGFDLLRSRRQDSPWRWVVAGWIPLYSQVREWELRSGLIFARKFRFDAAATWSTPGIAAKWTIPVDSTILQDSSWWRSDLFRYEFRLGGAPVKDLALQAWAGRRLLRDPGPGAESSWRTWGGSDFLGAQAGLGSSVAVWDFEIRAEQGRQSTLFDGSPLFATRPDSGAITTTAKFSTGSGRAKGTASLTKSVSLGLELSMAWMDLDDVTRSGGSLPPFPDSSGKESATRRLSATLFAPVQLPWLEVEPSCGLQRISQEGEPTPLWQEMSPRGHGVSWSMPWALKATRRGGLAGKISYALSGAFEVSGIALPESKLRHHLEMKQGF